jgi:hypothetical protein
MLRFVGNESEINLDTCHKEFLEWRWLPLQQVAANVSDPFAGSCPPTITITKHREAHRTASVRAVWAAHQISRGLLLRACCDRLVLYSCLCLQMRSCHSPTGSAWSPPTRAAAPLPPGAPRSAPALLVPAASRTGSVAMARRHRRALNAASPACTMQVVPFKRSVYQQMAAEFGPRIQQLVTKGTVGFGPVTTAKKQPTKRAVPAHVTRLLAQSRSFN